MTAKTLEEEASEAADVYADEYLDDVGYDKRRIGHAGYLHGYLAAATLREKELSELRQKLDDAIEQGVEEARQFKVEDEGSSAEIATLRARVAELEERAAQWVPESGLKSLMDQGWTEFYNDKRGNEPRLWLMIPPIPLPEGKSETDGQDPNR